MDSSRRQHLAGYACLMYVSDGGEATDKDERNPGNDDCDDSESECSKLLRPRDYRG